MFRWLQAMLIRRPQKIDADDPMIPDGDDLPGSRQSSQTMMFRLPQAQWSGDPRRWRFGDLN